MRCVFILKAMAVGMGLIASLWAGRAIAEEEFGTLAGVEAQAISSGEMAAVEGKLLEGLFSDNLPGTSFLGLFNLSGSGGSNIGDALVVLDPKKGLLASRNLDPDLGLLVVNLSGLSAPQFRPKNSDALGILGPDGLLFDANVGKKAPLLILQLQELTFGGLGR